jgi:hypothetical protein
LCALKLICEQSLPLFPVTWPWLLLRSLFTIVLSHHFTSPFWIVDSFYSYLLLPVYHEFTPLIAPSKSTPLKFTSTKCTFPSLFVSFSYQSSLFTDNFNICLMTLTLLLSLSPFLKILLSIWMIHPGSHTLLSFSLLSLIFFHILHSWESKLNHYCKLKTFQISISISNTLPLEHYIHLKLTLSRTKIINFILLVDNSQVTFYFHKVSKLTFYFSTKNLSAQSQ